jgi:S1-C subfamily serine protease
MTAPEVCSHCRASLSVGAHFCPSCGYLVSPEVPNWFDRLCAATVDTSIWIACSALLIWLGVKWWVIFAIWIVLTEIGYQLRGSIGKSFIGLSVPVKGRAQHYLRETIGKLASVATFGIGFLMVLSNEHLALHDYMAKTSVLRVGSAQRPRQAIISLSLIFGLATCAYFVLGPNKLNQSLPSFAPKQPTSLSTIVSQIPAVVTMYVYDSQGKSIGQGSGFVISGDGLCVTNFHVIKDAYSADVKLGDGRLYHLLSVHAYDADRDIAIFELGRKTSSGVEQARDLPFLTLATDEVQTGDRIATVSSPEGLSNSVADGLVSAIRNDRGRRLLQISAPISPGSSGGPVFNLKGEVVAISSFQLIEGQNLNFAIPADEVSRIRDQRANLSLEQLYWQFHLSSAARATTNAEASNAERMGIRSVVPKLLTGSFVGTVHNLTADVTANFGIFVKEEQGVIFGCMAVGKPLFGSGPLSGSAEGANIQFDVKSSAFTIQFTGLREGNRLSGTYSVLHPNGDTEQGEFVLRKKDSAELPRNFDPQKDCPKDTGVDR